MTNENEVIERLTRLEEQIKGLAQRWEDNNLAVKGALQLQAKEYDKHLDILMNERKTCEERHIILDDKVGRLERFDANLEGKASQQSVNVVTAIALSSLIVSLVIGVVGLLIR